METKMKVMNIFTEVTKDISNIPMKKKEKQALKIKRTKYRFVTYEGQLYCIYGSQIELDGNMDLIRTRSRVESSSDCIKESVLFSRSKFRYPRVVSLIYIVRYEVKDNRWTFVCSVAEEELHVINPGNDDLEIGLFVLQKNCRETYIFGFIGIKIYTYLFNFEHFHLSMQTEYSFEEFTRYNREDWFFSCSEGNVVFTHDRGLELSYAYSIKDNIWNENFEDPYQDQPNPPRFSTIVYSVEKGLDFLFRTDDGSMVKFFSKDVVTKEKTELCPPPFTNDNSPSSSRIVYIPSKIMKNLKPVTALLCSPTSCVFRWNTRSMVRKWREKKQNDD